MNAGEYLRELLDQGNQLFAAGDARGALRHYDQALQSFLETQHIAELRPIYQTIWNMLKTLCANPRMTASVTA